jgi:nucleolar protein 15
VSSCLLTPCQSNFQKKLEDIDVEEGLTPGTVYIGGIPKGFYKEQVREYFTQFGTVLKVRLARSKKTGGHKGYGYVQFASEDVAKIASEAMDNYLMFDKMLKCKVVKEEDLHPSIWKNAHKKFVFCNRGKRTIKMQNKERSLIEKKKNRRHILCKERARRRKLKDLGINYDFSGFSGAMKKEAKLNSGKQKLKKKKSSLKQPEKAAKKVKTKKAAASTT